MWGKICCALVAVIAVVLSVWVYNANRCHQGHPAPHKFLATKTPYLQNEGDLLHHKGHEACEAVQIWMVVRHGTRNPSAKVIRKMRTLLPMVRDAVVKAHEEGRGTLCDKELAELKNWMILDNLTEDSEKMLVGQGGMELKGIGKRFRRRFPNLLGKKYDNSTFKFKFTKTERAAESCKHFVGEIVGPEHAKNVWYPEPLSADPILRFYKGCPKWKKEVDKNPDAYIERKKFETSKTFLPVMENIRERGGFQDKVSLEAIEAMYMTCAFETAWTPDRPSPWCHLFDERDLEKMQYRQDLEYYWIDGYGFELTYKQACPAVRDMAEHLISKVEDPDSTPALIAYFTHSGTLLKLTSRLGLFNDTEKLLHDNFHLHANRKWRTSQIDKFATNVAAVLYKCSTEYKVGFLFQEQPVPIPGCGDDLCPLDEFLSQYHSVINDCDITRMCEI